MYLQRQLLDLLLELDVVLVGDVERHLQLSDGDLHLLLDAEDLGLEAGLGVGQATVQLLDLQRQGLPVKQRETISSVNVFLWNREGKRSPAPGPSCGIERENDLQRQGLPVG